jgi:hypothetical protein
MVAMVVWNWARSARSTAPVSDSASATVSAVIRIPRQRS